MTPNRIVLISRGRNEEYPADDGNTKPGMLLQIQSDGGVVAHATAGALTPVIVAKEDALQGGTINTTYTSGSTVFTCNAAKEDKLLMLLAIGANVNRGDKLMSNGDGSLNALNTGNRLYEILAPSTVITNVGTETAFSNGSYTIPANFLKVGDIIHVRTKVFLVAENSTNTHRIRLYLGASPITLADSTALQLAANDVVIFDLYLTVRTITSAGTVIADGVITYSISGTFTDTATTLASTTLDSTVAETLVIKSLASATSSGNQIRLDEMTVDLSRAGGQTALCQADEAINNSSGSAAAFIRVLVL